MQSQDQSELAAKDDEVVDHRDEEEPKKENSADDQNPGDQSEFNPDERYVLFGVIHANWCVMFFERWLRHTSLSTHFRVSAD